MVPSKKSLIINMAIASIIFIIGLVLCQIAQPKLVGIASGSSVVKYRQMLNAGIALMSLGGTYLTITLIIFVIYFVF